MLVLMAAGIVVCGVPTGVTCEEPWSEAQKEVWAAIETCSEHWAKGSLDEAMACVHDDFSGWLYTQPVPRTKEFDKRISAHLLKTHTTQAYELRPIDIKVYGDIGIAHYYFVQIIKDSEGKEVIEQGRWTDILLKQDDGWVWVADHGGVRPE
jgi:ketosteroid isomerase-like protein